MKTVKAQVPEGVRDVTGQEAFAKRALEQRLQTMFWYAAGLKRSLRLRWNMRICSRARLAT